MTDDIHAERWVTVTEQFKHDVGKDVIRKLVDEATDQVRRAVIDDAERRYPHPIPREDVRIVVEEERIHNPQETRIHIRATLRGIDIERAHHIHVMRTHPVMHFSGRDKIDDWAVDASKYVAILPEPHTNIRLLKAILDEALPNWKDVYDRLERAEHEARWTIEPFAKEYLKRPGVYKGLRADSFIVEDYAGKDSDSCAKK